MANSTNRILLADYLGGQASGAVMGRNYIKNPSGLFNTNNISVANSATVARNTTTPLTRIADIEVSLPNNTNGYAEWSANTTDLSIAGQNCEVRFDYIASSIGSQVFAQALDTGTVVAQQQLVASSSTRQFSLNVPCNGTGATTTVRITNATGNSGTSNIKVANMSYGKASNIGSVAQASFYGSATTAGTANCNWSRTSNQSFASFSADSDCPTPSVEGNASAPSTKIPAIRFTNMAPGDYQIVATGMFFASGTNQPCSFRFSDGTNVTSAQVVFASGSPGMPVITGKLSYTSAGDRTIEVQATGRDGNYPCDILANTATTTPFRIDVYRYPTSSEQAYRPDVLPASWSGYTGSASWSTTSTSFTDPTVSGTPALTQRSNVNFGSVTQASSNRPGITFTPPRVGQYLACAYPLANSATDSFAGYFRLYDGANVISTGSVRDTAGGTMFSSVPLCGVLTASSLSAITLTIQAATDSGGTAGISNPASSLVNPVEWSLVAINQSIPTPLLVGSVTSNSTGLERVERARLTVSGACTIASQSGSWLSSCTYNGAGNVTLNFASGMFSAAPSCVATAIGGNRSAMYGEAPSSSNWQVYASNNVFNSLSDNNFSVICMGPR